MHNLESMKDKYRLFDAGKQGIRRNTNTSIQKISIVIPTLNMGSTIEETILSIIRQDDSNYELIIIDGGSTDKTKKIIQEYSEFITYYESKTDNGQSSAINRGFDIATGDIYAWINADDFYLPEAFKVVRSVLNMNNGVGIVVGSGDVVTMECQFLKHISGFEMNRENLLNWNNDQWILQQACFWRSDIWKKSGGVDESLQLLMDYDLWLRFSDIGVSRAIEDSLAVMRYYKEAKTIKLRNRMKEEEAYVYAKNQAYRQLQVLVRELNLRCEALESRLKTYECSLIGKLLRRVGLLR